jgi:prepilin-type N-terminal cleavage/methylation domain-containing protein
MRIRLSHLRRHKPDLLLPEGFTLIETLVAMVVMTILATALYSGLSWGFAVVNLARENLRATQIAVEKMETLRMYSWDQVNSNGYVPVTFTAPFFPPVAPATNSGGILYRGTTLITNANVHPAYTDNMRLVVVTVNWTNRGILRTRKVETLISQYGMQRYIH